MIIKPNYALTVHKDLFDGDFMYPIKALSWKQPFAATMLFDKLETRNWETGYRGPVLLCASQAAYKQEALMTLSHPEQRLKMYNLMEKYPELYTLLGVAFAIGNLVDCRPMKPEDEQRAYVIYKPGLFIHEYKSIKRIEPFEYSGSQKWSIIDAQELLKKIVLLNVPK